MTPQTREEIGHLRALMARHRLTDSESRWLEPVLAVFGHAPSRLGPGKGGPTRYKLVIRPTDSIWPVKLAEICTGDAARYRELEPDNRGLMRESGGWRGLVAGDEIVFPASWSEDQIDRARSTFDVRPPRRGPGQKQESDSEGERAKRISGRRARAIYALLTRRVDLWEKLYQPSADSDDGGDSTLRTMLLAIGSDPVTGQSVGSANLTLCVDQYRTDVARRLVLFRAYMDVLCGEDFRLNQEDFLGRGGDLSGRGDYQGCGAANPIYVPGDTEGGELPDSGESANGRVMVLLFSPGSRVEAELWPCPSVEEDTTGCRRRFWADVEERRRPGTDGKPRRYGDGASCMACRFYERLVQASPCERPRLESGRPQYFFAIPEEAGSEGMLVVRGGDQSELRRLAMNAATPEEGGRGYFDLEGFGADPRASFELLSKDGRAVSRFVPDWDVVPIDRGSSADVGSSAGRAWPEESFQQMVFLQVNVLRLEHQPGHEACGYQPYLGADVRLRMGDSDLAPVLVLGGRATFALKPSVGEYVTVRILTKDATYHPMEALYLYEGRGRFRRWGTSKSDFGPAQGWYSGGWLWGAMYPNLAGFDAVSLVEVKAYVSPLSDVSNRVRDVISAAVSFQVDIVKETEAAENIHVVAYPPVDFGAAAPRFEKRPVDPGARVVCFELAGPADMVPKVIVTSWPFELAARFDPTAFRSSFLVFFHPSIGQGAASYPGPYPYSRGYLWHCGLKYLGYRGIDPIRDIYDAKGLIHQVAAAGRRLAVVMPVHKLGHQPEIGRFAEPEFVGEILHEIHAWWMRAIEHYSDPTPPSSCALAAFSNGNEAMAPFLDRGAGHPFCDRHVLEVYALDPPSTTGAMDAIIRATDRWMQRVGPDRRFRLYSQEPANGAFMRFRRNPNDPMPTAPFVLPRDDFESLMSSVEATRSVVVTPAASLASAADQVDPQPKSRRYGYWDAHAIIPATMVVDALRRSQFPSDLTELE
ncbi:MAG: hypothetical protein IT581_18225 [Verrucomicrobiales bacterium]|nr:hypothetical protein [Verrucomicrobiales bacterium]